MPNGFILSAMNPDWLMPQWPAPPAVRALCSTRRGGVSAGPYASLNLGEHVGDGAAAVAANRALLAQALGARPVFLQQTHGTDVASLDASSASGPVASVNKWHGETQREWGCSIAMDADVQQRMDGIFDTLEL